MDRLSGSPPPAIDSLSDPSALYLSMMRTASIALPSDVATKATAPVTKAVAMSPNAPLDLRLAAAESAAERGILASKTLVDIYSAVPFEASVLEDPLKHAEAEWGGRGRALLIRAAGRQNVPAARAEVLQEWAGEDPSPRIPCCFPDRAFKFPVSSSREFGQKSTIIQRLIRNRRTRFRPESPKFPVNSLHNREISRDEFARDSLHRFSSSSKEGR